MIDLEDRLRSAMHAAVDGAEPPDGLTAMVRRRHRLHLLRTAAAAAAVIALLAAIPVALAAGRGPGSRPNSGGEGHHHRASAPLTLRGQAGGTTPVLLLSGPRPGYAPGSDQVAGLPWTRSGYIFTRIIGGWSAEPVSSAPACCAGPRMPVYYLPDGGLAAVPVGAGYSAAAASSAGKLWLLSYRGRAQRLATAVGYARLYTISGRPAGPPIALPRGYLIVRAVGPYLLLKPANKPPLPVRDELWDPASRRVVRYITGVVGANRAEIAWEPACPDCALHVLNVLTGASFTVPVPAWTRAYSGTFSADGRYLAMALATVHGGQAVRSELAVIDMERKKLLPVPGSTLAPAASDQLVFGWDARQEQLIAALTVPSTPYSRLLEVATWRPGGRALQISGFAIRSRDWPVLGDSS